LHDREGWQTALDPEDGFAALYENMFGDPWGRVGKIGELLPVELEQPSLTLPFEPGETWAYTGGPHAAFEGNGPLAGLDFAPQTAESGCIPSNEWVVAMADGLVVRSEYGVVVQDLDGDGFEQTGWNLVYVHIGEEERVPLGVSLRAGERIGHPSCEGGRATGTHLHIARKYNGVWIPADGPCPFVLDGWLTQAGEQPYLGTLRRGLKTVTAHEFGSAVSLITRDVFTEEIDWPKNCPACRE
jgi:murein DD-endopeptidase MepM/ murein hydrolase activator NlpD